MSTQKNNLTCVDKEAAQWIADSTPGKAPLTSADQDAKKWNYQASGKRHLTSIDYEAAKLFSDQFPDTQATVSNFHVNNLKRQSQTIREKLLNQSVLNLTRQSRTLLEKCK